MNDAIDVAELCWRNACDHMPTGYGKEYDDHIRNALANLYAAGRRDALEEAAAMFETMTWEPYTNPGIVIRRDILATPTETKPDA